MATGMVGAVVFEGIDEVFGGVLYIEKPVEVEEGEILSFQFTNFTPQLHFVYILCFEETGERGGGC